MQRRRRKGGEEDGMRIRMIKGTDKIKETSQRKGNKSTNRNLNATEHTRNEEAKARGAIKRAAVTKEKPKIQIIVNTRKRDRGRDGVREME